MIYFMQPPEGGPIKIGFTDNPPLRHANLESFYGRTLDVLATMPGGRAEEAAMHARFDHLRLGRTEQFRPGPDLLAFLGRPIIVDLDPDAVEAMEGRREPGYDPERDDVAAKIERAIVGKARMIATHKGISAAEVLSDAARQNVDKLYAQMLRELDGKEGAK